MSKISALIQSGLKFQRFFKLLVSAHQLYQGFQRFDMVEQMPYNERKLRSAHPYLENFIFSGLQATAV